MPLDPSRRVPVVDLTRFSALRLPLNTALSEPDADAFIAFRKLSAAHVVDRLQLLRRDVAALLPLQVAVVPGQLTGAVLQPDGTPARDLAVGVDPPADLGGIVWGEPGAITGRDGSFAVRLPTGVRLPADRSLVLSIRGRDGEVEHRVTLGLRHPGLVGDIRLPQPLEPLPRSVLATLVTTLGWIDDALSRPQPVAPEPATVPAVRLGEDAGSMVFRQDLTRDRFRFRVLVRLIEPRLDTLRRTWTLAVPALRDRDGAGVPGTRFLSVGEWLGEPTWLGGRRDVDAPGPTASFTDRVPLDRALSVERFRDDVAGLEGGVASDERDLPLAATLGLGYVVNLSNRWTPVGLSLGNLVYSLPLAPGEQQRIAVFEEHQTLRVAESETLEVSEDQTFAEQRDASAEAVFSDAFSETVHGESNFRTTGRSSGSAVAGGLGFGAGPIVGGIGGGSSKGRSSASGSSSNTLEGARDYTSSATETLHSNLSRAAHAHRSVNRTAIRLATSSDRETAVTKVITNNNRTRALTMQYWEVLRHYESTTAVDGTTLVCFVPLDPIRFLPVGQPLSPDQAQLANRAAVLTRYGTLLKHLDVIQPRLPRELHKGADLLRQFAANPRAGVDLSDEPAQTEVAVGLEATVLPFDRVQVSVVTRRGRFGPQQLSGQVLPPRTAAGTPFPSTGTLMDALRDARENEFVPLTATVTVPGWVPLHDIVGIELSHRFRPFRYQLQPTDAEPAKQLLDQLAKPDSGTLWFTLFGEKVTLPGPDGQPRQVEIPAYLRAEIDAVVNGVRLDPEQLEGEFGGPAVRAIRAEVPVSGGQQFRLAERSDLGTLPTTGSLPVAAASRPPVMRAGEVYAIETLLQHVLRRTVTYSKHVWQSLTPEERVLLLEGYTLGVAADGAPDADQDVPLLNCVANEVLGYFGNAMIMPFSIPPAVAGVLAADSREGGQPLTTGLVQDALTAFHRGAFSPPVTTVTLPTRGVLGEAVLGGQPAAEQIDLTRFWNWQDSPTAQAPEIGTVSLGRGPDLTRAEAPDSVLGLQPMITNINTPDTRGIGELASALAKAGNRADLPDITGLEQLATLTGRTLDVAEAARADAMDTADSLAGQALKAAPEVLKASAEREQAQRTRDDTAREKQERQAAEDRKGNLLSLKANAATLMTEAGTLPAPEAAAFARKVIGSQTAGMSAGWLADLLASFHQTENGEPTAGSVAFRNAILSAMQTR